MKATKFILLLVLALVMFNIPGVAQVTNDLDLPTSEEIAECARMEVGLFTDKLSSIVLPKQSPKNRETLKKGALYLFIGKGEDYDTYVYDNLNICIDTINHEAVKMQTTTLRDTTIRKNTPMARYLDTLVKRANERKYTYVTIKTTDWKDMKTSKIRKIGDGEYVIDVFFEQWYDELYITDFNRKRLVRKSKYRDRTLKRVECKVEISDFEFGRKVVIRLGDIFAEETVKYDK